MIVLRAGHAVTTPHCFVGCRSRKAVQRIGRESRNQKSRENCPRRTHHLKTTCAGVDGVKQWPCSMTWANPRRVERPDAAKTILQIKGMRFQRWQFADHGREGQRVGCIKFPFRPRGVRGSSSANSTAASFNFTRLRLFRPRATRAKSECGRGLCCIQGCHHGPRQLFSTGLVPGPCPCPPVS